MRRLLVLVTLCMACAGKRGDVSSTPSWATKSGRDKAKLELAAALLDNGNAEAALQLIGQMRASGTRGPGISVMQGRALADLGLTDDAEKVLGQVARRHPGNVDAANTLGILYMDERRVKDAITRFRQAARSAPKNASVHNNLGFALMAAGRNDEAVEVLRKALSFDGSQIRTRNNLGFALVATGQDKAAWRVFRASGDSADARYNLALAQELRGDVDAAMVSYTTALTENPDLGDARAAIQRLREIEHPPEEPSDDATSPSDVSSPPEENSP